MHTAPIVLIALLAAGLLLLINWFDNKERKQMQAGLRKRTNYHSPEQRRSRRQRHNT